VTRENHECNQRYCENFRQNREAAGHLCYMRPMKDALPSDGDRVQYVFYDFENTQNTRYSDKATEYVPKLVCVQQFCSQCEGLDDCGDCVR